MDLYLRALADSRHTDELRRADAIAMGRWHPAPPRPHRLRGARAALGRALIAAGNRLLAPVAAPGEDRAYA